VDVLVAIDRCQSTMCGQTFISHAVNPLIIYNLFDVALFEDYRGWSPVIIFMLNTMV
jgi:hypothetical protein